MAQRTVCLCGGKYIGIETIYTVVNGQQINIPDKLRELRVRSQNNELFCPCGCGANLILVAGDRNLKEQHFRLKDGTYGNLCHAVTEGKTSIDSKVVLKCWLDEKLRTDEIETRVPINLLEDVKRKYEFSFLSRSRKIAVSYCHDRANLSDEKFEILEANSKNIHIIYIVDAMNSGGNGQYPEALMKIQNRQGYCLLLEVENASYSDAVMSAVFYTQDIDGLWREIKISEGYLCDYWIDDGGQVWYKSKLLTVLLREQTRTFENWIETEKLRHEEEEKQRLEVQKRLLEEMENKKQEFKKRQQEIEEEQKLRRAKEMRRREEKEAERQAQIRHQDEAFKREMASKFSQQETQVRDASGVRWIKCEFCGLIARESEFLSYGGLNHVNLGRCKQCSDKKETERQVIAVSGESDEKPASIRYNPFVCPECGGKLREKNGQYGRFMGCSNYPRCRYTRKIKK